MEPSGKIQPQAWMAAPETQRVMKAIGGNARFVGGCVRNALLNKPVMDIDIATPLKPHEVISKLDKAGIRYISTGIKHGTVTAIVDGHPFEITTLRQDVATYGRHADVAFTDDWHIDAARRDFTINAMSCTLDGELFDPFEGVKDLREGRVRFVGDAQTRIQEDVLRILRFFRFHAHYGRDAPDRKGLAACKALAHLIPALSIERVRDETMKLLTADNAASVWQVMRDAGVTERILPQAVHIGDLARLIGLELEMTSPDALRRLGCLLNTTSKEARKTAQNFRLSNAQVERLAKMAEPHDEVNENLDEKETRYLIFKLGHAVFIDRLLLNAARREDHQARRKIRAIFDIADTWKPPVFQVTGTDVMKLGVPAGVQVGKVLAQLQEWWAQGDFIAGRKECLDQLKKISAPAKG